MQIASSCMKEPTWIECVIHHNNGYILHVHRHKLGKLNRIELLVVSIVDIWYIRIICHTCANFIILGGTFLLRKSHTFKFCSRKSSSSPVRSPLESETVASLMSLLTRISRIVIDNSLLTSELKKLLRIVISSICCKFRSKNNIRQWEEKWTGKKCSSTYDRESIFNNFDCT